MGYMDGYSITINLNSNLIECFQHDDGDTYDIWVDDFIHKIFNEISDMTIAYKNFYLDIDMDEGVDNIIYIRLWDENFTEWRDETKLVQYIQECEKEKENIIKIINEELINNINNICSKLDICKFPNSTSFVYNSKVGHFFIEWTASRDIVCNNVIQLKYEPITDIDFEYF